MNRRPGFTLIELLVVIAIIAILVSILMPSLSRAKALARLASCAVNQKNTGLALHMYANDYGEWPVNEPPISSPSDEFNGHNWGQYRYSTRGGNLVMWMYYMDGPDGYKNRTYACTESLPADNEVLGSVTRNGLSWNWACRTSPSYPQEFDQAVVPNGQRNWFCYLAPLRKYPSQETDPKKLASDENSTYDIWGAGYQGSSAGMKTPPISSESKNLPNSFNKPRGRQVIAYCPSMVQADVFGSSPWWHNWTAPHMKKPVSGLDGRHGALPVADSRNYLFTDGHVEYVHYGDN